MIRLAEQYGFALGRHFDQALAEASLGIRNPQEGDSRACQAPDISVEHKIAHKDSVFAIPVGNENCLHTIHSARRDLQNLPFCPGQAIFSRRELFQVPLKRSREMRQRGGVLANKARESSRVR